MEPITRKENYLAKVAGMSITPPEPITREEKFLAKAGGMNVKTPEPLTRVEKYLQKIIEKAGDSSGGGGGKILYMDAELLNAGGAYPVDADDYTTAVIPSEATFVDVEAFANLPNLDTLIVNGDCEFEVYEEYDSNSKTTKVYNTITKYRIPLRKLIIKDRTTGVPAYFLREAQPLFEIAVSGSVGDSAFWGCNYLGKVALENCLSIGNKAFSACWGLRKFTFPAGVTSIGAGAFSGCRSLTEISIPDSVTSIGAWTFTDCTALTEITIPESVMSVGEFTFQNCTALATVTILNAEAIIESYAFYNCPTAMVIRGYAGSTAETFATENGYTFEVIA